VIDTKLLPPNPDNCKYLNVTVISHMFRTPIGNMAWVIFKPSWDVLIEAEINLYDLCSLPDRRRTPKSTLTQTLDRFHNVIVVAGKLGSHDFIHATKSNSNWTEDQYIQPTPCRHLTQPRHTTLFDFYFYSSNKNIIVIGITYSINIDTCMSIVWVGQGDNLPIMGKYTTQRLPTFPHDILL